jgi:hypothetical protein
MHRSPSALAVAFLLCACGGAAETPPGDVRDDVAADTALIDAASPPELAAQVRELMPRLERLSGLDRVATLRVRMQDRAAAREYVTRRLDEEMPPAERDAVRRTYVALGLLPDTLDLDALLLDLYTEQVLGYYDPTSGTMFVVEGSDTDALGPVLAHELVHALQDQHTDLDSIIAPSRGNDRQVAAHAAMEGHAMLVMFAVLAEQASGRRVDPATLPDPARELAPALAAQNDQFPVFRSAPAVIRETLLFPYLGGAGFVHALWTARAPLARYPAPIDSLLPQSTEQVMRPGDRFITRRDAPVELVLEDLPAGWEVLRQDNLGQLETGIFLSQHLGEAARSRATGWNGDRYVLLATNGADVLHWVSVWESTAIADAFADGVRRSAARRPGRAVHVERLDLAGHAAVRVVDAPAGLDAAALPAPRAAVRTR